MGIAATNHMGVGSGKSMQTLNLSNSIATCKKLLNFSNLCLAQIRIVPISTRIVPTSKQRVQREYYTANGDEHDETLEWMER